VEPACRQDLSSKESTMADPRNIAHDKKVDSEKKKHGEEIVPDAAETPQPGKKPTLVQNDSPGDSYQQHAKLHPSDVPEEA
jgi:hypothetical protein